MSSIRSETRRVSCCLAPSFDTELSVQYAGCYIIFFDAGTYIVTSTITIPAGTQVVGEAWSTIMANGSYFQDYNHPQVVVRVGEPQSEGVAEITDMIFTARGPGMYMPLCWR